MKRIVKRPLKAIWRFTLPLRRPFSRRFEALVARAVTHPAPHVHVSCQVSEETSLLMDHMIRELVRLQAQIDRLSEAVDDLNPASSPFAVVGRHESEPARKRSVAS